MWEVLSVTFPFFALVLAGYVAARRGMPATAGSDAHDPTDVGVCATDFDGRITGLRDLIDALHGGRYRPRWLSARA